MIEDPDYDPNKDTKEWILLIILIIGAIGFLTWLYYQK